MRLKPLPTTPEALGKLLDAVQAYRARLKARHEDYCRVVPAAHARIRHAEQTGQPPPIGAIWELVAMDELHAAHSLADPDFQPLTVFMDLPIERLDDGPDPARPEIAGPRTLAAWLDWLGRAQAEACDAGSSPDAPILDLLRRFELDVFDALDRPSAGPPPGPPRPGRLSVDLAAFTVSLDGETVSVGEEIAVFFDALLRAHRAGCRTSFPAIREQCPALAGENHTTRFLAKLERRFPRLRGIVAQETGTGLWLKI
jgi:hypothetical protein